MKRQRNDSVKSGCGIDGSLGEKYTKTGAVNPWRSNPEGSFVSPKGRGTYQDASSGLTNKLPDNNPDDVRDILDQVEAQSSDSGNRAVKSGSRD
jgi:hypothetical protein